MGYMTVISVLNDGWETIKNHADEFMENIENGMQGGHVFRRNVNTFSVGNHCNPMEVSKSFHADNAQVFYVGQNCMTMLTDWTTNNKRDIEFQLKRIKDAKSMINYREKELKEKLNIISAYEKAKVLECKKDYKEWTGKETELIFKAGEKYRILRNDFEGSKLIMQSEKENPIMINTLEFSNYFHIVE